MYNGTSAFLLVQEGEIMTSLLFTLYLSVFSSITSLPFDLYSTFVVEERYDLLLLKLLCLLLFLRLPLFFPLPLLVFPFFL